MTQVEIAGSTGLSPATVSNMVRELDGAGAVELAPSIRNGRRAVLVSLATGNTLLAGIAFGDRDVRVALATGPREIVGRQRMPLPASHNADEGMERAARLLYDLVEKSGKTIADVRAVGVGVPGPRRQRDRAGGLREHPARMARCRRRRRDARPTGRPCLGRQHVQPRRSRGAEVRCAARGPGRRLHQALLRRRRRPGARWRGVPGQRRHGRRDRPPHDRRARTDLPVRQPGVPRDLHRLGRPQRGAGRVARSSHAPGHHRQGDRRRP